MDVHSCFHIFIVILILFISTGAALQCYQCDSNEDESCPSWQPFDHNINALIDCMSFEAYTPGTFCLKVTRESPGWFGWRKMTRRCGSRSDTGVAWGCRWVYEDNGVWKETCYCDDRDGCNTSSLSAVPLRLASLLLIVAAVTLLHRIV